MKNNRCMLTTFDNPYDPFEQFENWFAFDTEKGYDSCAYLARVAHVSSELTDEENNAIIEEAIDEILKYDFTNQRTKRYAKNAASAENAAARADIGAVPSPTRASP